MKCRSMGGKNLHESSCLFAQWTLGDFRSSHARTWILDSVLQLLKAFRKILSLLLVRILSNKMPKAWDISGLRLAMVLARRPGPYHCLASDSITVTTSRLFNFPEIVKFVHQFQGVLHSG